MRQVAIVVRKHLGRILVPSGWVASPQCLRVQHNDQDPADVQNEPPAWSQDIEHTDKQRLVAVTSNRLGSSGHDHIARIGSSARRTTPVCRRGAIVTVADELGLELRDHYAKVDALHDRAGDEDPVQEYQGLEPAELGHAGQVECDKEADTCVEGVDDGVDDLDGGGGVDPDGGLHVSDIET